MIVDSEQARQVTRESEAVETTDEAHRQAHVGTSHKAGDDGSKVPYIADGPVTVRDPDKGPEDREEAEEGHEDSIVEEYCLFKDHSLDSLDL